MDTEYILGCSLELAETTALENAVLSSRLGAYDAIRALVDSNAAMPEHYLQNTAGACLQNLAPDTRHVLALQSLGALEFSLQAWQEWLEHNVQVKAQLDLGMREAPRGLLALPAPVAHRALVRSEADINENLVRGMLDDLGHSMRQRFERDLIITELALASCNADQGQRLRKTLSASAFAQSGIDIGPAAQRALKAAQKQKLLEAQKKESRARAAIKKATRLFENLGQDQHLRLFVSGAEVVLAHPNSKFKFVLKPLQTAGWLLDRTQEGRSHTPYELSLLTKDDVFLANLCVYFDKTPVLDQLLALTLFIQSGEELKVLEKANWFGLQQWDAAKQAAVLGAYPSLARKLPQPRTEPSAEQRDIVGMLNPAFKRQMDHWEPYTGPVRQWVRTWMEPVRLAAQPLVAAAPSVLSMLNAVKDPQRLGREELRCIAQAA